MASGAMSRVALIATFVLFSCARAQTSPGPGCADGTREGFFDAVAFPKIAACAGSAMGVDVTSIAASTQFCADGCVLITLSQRLFLIAFCCAALTPSHSVSPKPPRSRHPVPHVAFSRYHIVLEARAKIDGHSGPRLSVCVCVGLSLSASSLCCLAATHAGYIPVA